METAARGIGSTRSIRYEQLLQGIWGDSCCRGDRGSKGDLFSAILVVSIGTHPCGSSGHPGGGKRKSPVQNWMFGGPDGPWSRVLRPANFLQPGHPEQRSSL